MISHQKKETQRRLSTVIFYKSYLPNAYWVQSNAVKIISVCTIYQMLIRFIIPCRSNDCSRVSDSVITKQLFNMLKIKSFSPQITQYTCVIACLRQSIGHFTDCQVLQSSTNCQHRWQFVNASVILNSVHYRFPCNAKSLIYTYKLFVDRTIIYSKSGFETENQQTMDTFICSF